MSVFCGLMLEGIVRINVVVSQCLAGKNLKLMRLYLSLLLKDTVEMNMHVSQFLFLERIVKMIELVARPLVEGKC